MNEKNHAFQRPRGESNGRYNDSQEGMHLRDYFAAAALQGILASNYDPYGGEASAASDNAACALHAYEIADAMLAERAK